MASHFFPKAILAVCLGTTGILSSACTVYETAPAGPPAPYEGYEPQYYNGAVVYYDDGGRPFYYEGERVVWVEPGAPIYAGLVAHWRVNHVAYARWYGHGGARYRTYRRR